MNTKKISEKSIEYLEERGKRKARSELSALALILFYIFFVTSIVFVLMDLQLIAIWSIGLMFGFLFMAIIVGLTAKFLRKKRG